MSVHPQASAYDGVAGEYERGRPGYPGSLLDWIRSRGRLLPGCTVVDLAAGTGKLTRLLVESGATVIAVEPLAAMREEFKRVLPNVEVLDAAAESIPLPDAFADVLTCGQAFHWFANEPALGEISRVLRPDGEFLLASNGYDKANPLQQRLSEIRREAESAAAETTPGTNWREVLRADPRFELVDEVVLPNPYFVDRQGVFARLRSSSPFARLPVERQRELMAGLEELIEGDVVDMTQLTRAMALRKIVS